MMCFMVTPSFTLIDETSHYIVVLKDHGLPTVPLKKEIHSDSLLKQVSSLYPEVLLLTHEGLVLHRLDTATRGLVLIARSVEAFYYFQEEQRRGRFEKRYHALSSFCDELPSGYPPQNFTLQIPGTTHIVSSFRPYGKGRREVRPTTDQSSSHIKKKGSDTLYTSHVTYLKRKDESHHLFSVSLHQGFRHQVRNHLCWAHYPIIGDPLYGRQESQFLHLIASKIRFFDYMNQELKEYSIMSDELDPFEDSLYKESNTT